MSSGAVTANRPGWAGLLLRGPADWGPVLVRVAITVLILGGAALMVVSVAVLVFDVEVGMFGFKDSWSVPYAMSTLYEEIVGAVVLLIAAVVLTRPAMSARSPRAR